MSALKSLPEDFYYNLRTDQGMTLIIVMQSGGVEYANRTGEKDDLLAKREPTDRVLLAWTGQWRTDIFELSAADLDKYYKRVAR